MTRREQQINNTNRESRDGKVCAENKGPTPKTSSRKPKLGATHLHENDAVRRHGFRDCSAAVRGEVVRRNVCGFSSFKRG